MPNPGKKSPTEMEASVLSYGNIATTSTRVVSSSMLELSSVIQSRENSHSALAVMASTASACGFGSHADDK